MSLHDRYWPRAVKPNERAALNDLVARGIQACADQEGDDERMQFLIVCYADVIRLDVSAISNKWPEKLTHWGDEQYWPDGYRAEYVPRLTRMRVLAKTLISQLVLGIEPEVSQRHYIEYVRQETDLKARDDGMLAAAVDIRFAAAPLLSARVSRGQVMLAAYRAANGRMPSAAIEQAVTEEIAMFMSRVRHPR